MRTRGYRLFAAIALLLTGVTGLQPPLAVAQPAADPPAASVTIATCSEGAFNAALGVMQFRGGGVITFSCTGTIPVTVSKTISKNVWIDGNGGVTFDGGGSTRLFTINQGATLTLEGVTLTRGGKTNGSAAVVNGGTLHIIDCILTNNRNDPGFGYYGRGGALYNYPWGVITINDSTLSNNYADTEASAIYNLGTLTATDTTFSGNETEMGYSLSTAPSGAVLSTGTATFIASTFVNNGVSTNGFGHGGAIYNTGSLTVIDSTFSGNFAREGGAIYAHGGVANITSSSFTSNQSGDGGAIYADGYPPFNVSSVFNITASAFTGNSAAYGGAIFNRVGTVNIDWSTLSGNTAPWGGAAIENSDGLNIAFSTLSGNDASQPDGHGGAIRNFGAATISASTLTGNSAAYGGAISNLVNGTLTITGSTISGNSGSLSGALDGAGSQMTIGGTIVAGNPASVPVISVNCTTGPLNSLGSNLSDETSCGFNDPSDIQNSANIDLNALADNGGPTQTMLPQATSDAIDAANCVASTVRDQRDVHRPAGAACDIGAVEVGGTLHVRVFALYGNGDEGGNTTVNAIAYGPAGVNLDYDFDCDNNGSYETQGSGTGNQGTASCAFADNGNFIVPYFICEAGNNSNCAAGSGTVKVANLYPSISSVTNSGPVDEGSAAMITVNASDPAGASDPLQYAFDCKRDGYYEVGPQSSSSGNCTFPDNGSYTVYVRVTDGDGGLDTAPTVVTVNNVAPEIQSMTVDPAPSNEGQNVVASATFSDPGTLDTHTCTVDYGDDSGVQAGAVSGNTCTGPSHLYTDDIPSGTPQDDYTVTIVVTDNDLESDTKSLTHTVVNLPPTIDSITTNSPISPGQAASITVDASDPGVDDILSYSFDCDNDTNYEIGPQSNSSTQCNLEPGVATSTIGIQVTDDDGGITTDSVEVKQELAVCLSFATGTIKEAGSGGSCPSGSYQMELPAAYSLTFCISSYTGELRWSTTGSCSSGERTHVIPDDGPLYYCEHTWTGRLRAPAIPWQCSAYEIPGVIPG